MSAEYYHYTYRKYKYSPKVIIRRDTRKIEHEIFDSEGNLVKVADFTPYCFMSQIDFQHYVDLSFPNRDSGMILPFSSHTLRMKYSKPNR